MPSNLRNIRNICFGMGLVLLTSFNLAQAAPVGTVQTDFGGREGIMGTALQADGKLVAAGFFYGSSYDNSFALARYGTDGKLDPTFGTAGKVLTTTFAATSGYAAQAEATAVAIQADGKIVAAGFTYTDDIALARYNPNGSLDTTFGTGGKVVTDWGSRNDYAYTVGVQSTGKIIVGGYANTNGTFDFVMTRYNSNGTVDTAFGSNGTVFTDFASSDDRIAALKIITGDKIVAVGRSGGNMAVARYTVNGSLDSTFGSGGKVTTDFGGNYDEARAVAIDASGKIVVTGPAGVNGDIGLARYTTGGVLDSKFGSGGKVVTNLGSFNDQSAAIGINLTSGKISVAGYAGNGFEVLRYTSAGALDNTFGSGGRVTTSINPGFQEAVALALQADGKVVASGRSGSQSTGSQDNFTLVRYDSTGKLDPSYGAKADLAVSISASPATLKIGSNVTYTITVTNNGPDSVDGLPINGTPAGANFVSASATSGICDSYGTCVLGNLASGASATVTTVASPTILGTLTNTITINSTTADTNPANNTASVNVLVDGAADLSVSASATPATPKYGDSVTYTVTVTNHGPDASANAVLNLSFYNGERASLSSSLGSCEPYYPSCNLGSIASGASAVVTLVLKVYQNENYSVVATASSLNDPALANNSATASVVVNTVYDVVVSIAASPEPVHVGQNLTYRINVKNLGPDAARTDIFMTNSFFFERDIISLSSTTGTCYADNMACDLGIIPAGASIDVTLVVTPRNTGPFTMTARARTITVSDPNPGNDEASVTSTVIGAADLALSVTDSPDPVRVGNILTYTITLTNNGPDNANQTWLSATIAAGAYITSIVTPQGYCSGSSYISCNLGVLNSGATITITASMIYDLGTGLISSQFNASSGINDPNTANNTATVDTTVTGSADLAVSMTASPNPVRTGQKVTYAIAVTNNGPDLATNTILTDSLPSGLTLVSAISPQGYYCSPGSTITCYLGKLYSGASVTFNIVATANINSGTVANSASVTNNVTDPNMANNSATTLVTVR